MVVTLGLNVRISRLLRHLIESTLISSVVLLSRLLNPLLLLLLGEVVEVIVLHLIHVLLLNHLGLNRVPILWLTWCLLLHVLPALLVG